MAWKSVKAIILFASIVGTSFAQTLRIRDVMVSEPGLPRTVNFSCTADYNAVQCVHDVKTLQHELARYPLDGLGRWSFVLAPSDHWAELVAKLKGNPVSPAFSVLDQGTTVFEQALFSAAPARSWELMQVFGALGAPLLRLAITHELGHAMCAEMDERRADEFGRELRSREAASCATDAHQRSSSSPQARSRSMP